MAINSRKSGDLEDASARLAEKLQDKLSSAEVKRQAEAEAKLEKTRAINGRVAEAQERKEDAEITSAETAQKLAERLAEAEARKIAEVEAKLEKTRRMNQRVGDAQERKEATLPARSPSRSYAEKMAQAEQRHFAEAESKLEKTRQMNRRVEEAQMRRVESAESSDVAGRDAIHQKLVDAEARRMALQEESKMKAATPSKADEVRVKRERDAAEASLRLKERQTAAEERHEAVLAESREKGASVARKALGISSQQHDREWVAREDLAQNIASKLRDAELRRQASLDSSSKSAPSTPAKISPSSPGNSSAPTVPFNTPVATQTGM